MATRKVEDGQKTFFPRIVRGPLGCYLLSSLVPKSRYRGSGKIIFFTKVLRLEKMQHDPLSIFHAAVRPESSPGVDLGAYHIFAIFGPILGPLGPKKASMISIVNCTYALTYVYERLCVCRYPIAFGLPATVPRRVP